MKYEDEQRVRRAIVRTLTNYPKVSSAMLGLHIRPYNPDWMMVLNSMVEEGTVVRSATRDNHPGFCYELTNAEG